MDAEDLRRILEKEPHKLIQILSNEETWVLLNTSQIVDMIKELSDDDKIQILRNAKLLSLYRIKKREIISIFTELSDDGKRKVLSDEKLLKKQLKLSDFDIVNLTAQLQNTDEENVKFIIKFILENPYLIGTDIIELLSVLSNEKNLEFYKEHKDIFISQHIYLYQIVRSFGSDQQREFAENINNMDLADDEKRQILATLDESVKKSLDIEKIPEEFREVISIPTNIRSGLITEKSLDSIDDMEIFRGLDILISINPEELNEEQKAKLKKLCKICPNLKVHHFINRKKFESEAKEYLEGEQWIEELINSLNPEYSALQKLAVIDNAIGRKISYSPDFDTEIFDGDVARTWWKIISSGYGVCNGIASLECYILKRVGINCETISSWSHTFLVIKDIELPLANGEVVKGDTLLDPTWNLMTHRFGAMPDCFCINYEQAREMDIDDEGKDQQCHQIDLLLKDIPLLSLDEDSLRALFKSVGLTDKDGRFPIKEMKECSVSIDEMCANDLKENIGRQFLLLRNFCPGFTSCQDSSMGIIRNLLLKNKHMKFNRCIVNRVYERCDEKRKPVMYVYIDSEEIGKIFCYADKDRDIFIALSSEEFIKRFECYDKDLEKAEGKRPWEVDSKEQKEDLIFGSGKIVIEEEEEK